MGPAARHDAPSPPRDAGNDARGLDPAAARRHRHLLSAAAEPPWLHREVGRRLLDHLDPLAARPRRIVEWWAHAGGLGPELERRQPQAEHVRVEPVEARLRRAPGRPAWWRRLIGATPVPALHDDDADEAIGVGLADLVVANMALQAVDDIPALFARWQRLLVPGGVAAFATLGPGTLPELRAIYAQAGWPPPSPVYTDMHDLGDMLVHAGFTAPVLDQETLSLTYADADAAIAELRAIGRNAHPARSPGLHTPRHRDRLRAALDALRAPDGRIALRYEVAYGHGFKGEPRARSAPGEPQPVSLAALRHGRAPRR